MYPCNSNILIKQNSTEVFTELKKFEAITLKSQLDKVIFNFLENDCIKITLNSSKIYK